jgi:response regulator RpfG family c-di-GMP phosphodiesterase
LFSSETIDLEKALEIASTPETTQAAIELAERVLKIPADAPRSDRTSAANALIAVYAQLYRIGDVSGSARALAAAITISYDLEPKLRVVILLRMGELELFRSDLSSALTYLSMGLEIAQRAGVKVEEARALISYAMALQATGLHKQADVLFDQALFILKDLDEPRLIGKIWSWRVQLKTYNEPADFDAARFACEQALAFGERSEPLIRDAMVCTAICNWAAIELLRAGIGAARELLSRASSRPNIDIRSRWLVNILMAIADIQEQNTAEKRAVLDQLMLPHNAPSPVYVIEAYSVVASSYSLIGDSLHAAEALTSLTAERAKAFFALVRHESDASSLLLSAATTGAMPDKSVTNPATMLERMAVTAELRDDITGKHCFRVGRMAALVARRAGLDAETIARMDLAARLHDVGKVAIPDAILLKPGRLDSAEIRLMQTHTTIGADLLSGELDPMLQTAQLIARHHHECWDGSGYPDGLAGEAIPLEARVTALADVFDALTHVRPYKAAWSRPDAVAFISVAKGKQFDPRLTDVFLSLIREAEDDWATFYAHLEDAANESPFAKAQVRLAPALSP